MKQGPGTTLGRIVARSLEIWVAASSVPGPPTPMQVKSLSSFSLGLAT